MEKQVIKQVLGRSPDDAESWGMGIAHIGKAKTPDEIELLTIQEAVHADFEPDDDYPRLSLKGLGL